MRKKIVPNLRYGSEGKRGKEATGEEGTQATAGFGPHRCEFRKRSKQGNKKWGPQIRRKGLKKKSWHEHMEGKTTREKNQEITFRDKIRDGGKDLVSSEPEGKRAVVKIRGQSQWKSSAGRGLVDGVKHSMTSTWDTNGGQRREKDWGCCRHRFI